MAVLAENVYLVTLLLGRPQESLQVLETLFRDDMESNLLKCEDVKMG